MSSVKKIISLILTLVILSSLIGCKSNYKEAYIYFELPETPSMLDPQTASTDSELLIVKNIYEGLLRKNSSGAIVYGIAKNYTYDNLTYTFNLRDDAVWSNSEKITSNDFVFAFKRAVSKSTEAPFVSRLFCIKGAENIYKNDASSDTLGVTAPDDNTLIINLENEDENFLDTLCSSICMPCNQKFFENSQGKYGLSNDYTISSGSYRLAKWNQEAFGIRLYKNEKYTGTMVANNSAVFLTCSEDEKPIDKLIKNSVDMAFIDSSLSDKAKENNLNVKNYQNICWFLTFGNKFSLNLRKSLMMLIGDKVYSNDLQAGYSIATSIFPSSLVKNASSTGLTLYDNENGKKLFSKEIASLNDNKFPSNIKLYYYDNNIVKPIVTDIVGHWQNNLAAYVNIESVSKAEILQDELKEQTYDMTFFPVRADSKNVKEYLEKFLVNYHNESLDEVQNKILESKNIIPIAFQNTSIAYSKALSEVVTEMGNGYVDFSFIIKTE